MVQHAEDYKWSSYRVILGMSDDKITHSNRGSKAGGTGKTAF